VEVGAIVFSSFLSYAHQLLSHLLWSVLRDIALVQILSHSMKRVNDKVQQKNFTATAMHQLMLHQKLKPTWKFSVLLSVNKNYLIIPYNSMPWFTQNFR
jgi:hypothetical protein